MRVFALAAVLADASDEWWQDPLLFLAGGDDTQACQLKQAQDHCRALEGDACARDPRCTLEYTVAAYDDTYLTILVLGDPAPTVEYVQSQFEPNGWWQVLQADSKPWVDRSYRWQGVPEAWLGAKYFRGRAHSNPDRAGDAMVLKVKTIGTVHVLSAWGADEKVDWDGWGGDAWNIESLKDGQIVTTPPSTMEKVEGMAFAEGDGTCCWDMMYHQALPRTAASGACAPSYAALGPILAEENPAKKILDLTRGRQELHAECAPCPGGDKCTSLKGLDDLCYGEAAWSLEHWGSCTVGTSLSDALACMSTAIAVQDIDYNPLMECGALFSPAVAEFPDEVTALLAGDLIPTFDVMGCDPDVAEMSKLGDFTPHFWTTLKSHAEDAAAPPCVASGDTWAAGCPSTCAGPEPEEWEDSEQPADGSSDGGDSDSTSIAALATIAVAFAA